MNVTPHTFDQIHVLNKTTYCGEVGLLPYHPTWMLTINNVNHLLLVTNSSSNFIIYCFMGQQFKQVLRKKITR